MTTAVPSALQRLENYAFPVMHSAGVQSRAKQLAARCERAYHYLTGVLGFDPRVRLLVLSPDDWAAHADFPLYGVPHTAHAEAVILGEQPAEFWQGVVQMLDGVLTPTQRAEMEAVYGVVDGQISMASFNDLLVVHELGHLFHQQVPFAFPRLWLMELFANFCLHAYIAEREPEQLPVWTILPERMMALPPERMRHRSLDDFERLYAGVGLENYAWYQFRLAAAATSTYDAAGVEALKRLYQTFAAWDGNATGDVTDEHLATLLGEQVHLTIAQMMRTWPS